jgi:hypothetical protein
MINSKHLELSPGTWRPARLFPASAVFPSSERARRNAAFSAAVHLTHAVRPAGCWAPKDIPLAAPQTSGRQRLNIQGAIDLETGKTRMIEATTVNAISMILLLWAIEAMYPASG